MPHPKIPDHPRFRSTGDGLYDDLFLMQLGPDRTAWIVIAPSILMGELGREDIACVAR